MQPAPTKEELKAKRDREDQERLERAYAYRQKQFEKAVKIPDAEWDAPVYCPYDRGSEDGFFRSVEEYLEWEEDEELSEDEQSSFLWATKPHGLSISVDHVIENALDDMYEDAYDNLKGVDKLTQAIDEFLKTHKHVVSYEVDYSKTIILDRGISQRSISKGSK